MNSEPVSLRIEPKSHVWRDGDLEESDVTLLCKSACIAVDLETTGLNIDRDRICIITFCDELGNVISVRPWGHKHGSNSRIHDLLGMPFKNFLAHYAYFDFTFLEPMYGVVPNMITCTRALSKIARTYASSHSLKDVIAEMFPGVKLDKTITSTYWGALELTQEQKDYVAQDVVYLISLARKLTDIIVWENRVAASNIALEIVNAKIRLRAEGFEDVTER